jgi:tripartite-type tricarboxylate transporter receptor subunit TctC
MNITVKTGLFAASLAMLSLPALAADYPNKPITFLNGAGVGGGVDSYGRVLASVAPDVFDGQPMIVVNKPGGAHTVALKTLARAKPDGYTLAVVSGGSAMIASTIRDIGLDYFGDLEFVAQIGGITSALLVRKGGVYKTPQDVIAAAKANPGGLRYGHSGRGAVTHVAMLSWLTANGVTMQDVPFKGGGQSRAALIAGDIDVLSTGAQQLSGFEDKVSALGVLAGSRDGAFPDIPTMEEQGTAGIDVYSPVIVYAPKGTPKEIIARLEKGIADAFENKAFKKLGNASNLNLKFRGSAETRAMMEGLLKDWTPSLEAVKATMK